MNNNYFVEEKYNLGIGLYNILQTEKLIKHYEFIQDINNYFTIDIYENGLITYTNITDKNVKEFFRINITNGVKLEDDCKTMITNVYNPFCERMISSTGDYEFTITWGLNPNIKEKILLNTIESLKIIKKIYEHLTPISPYNNFHLLNYL